MLQLAADERTLVVTANATAFTKRFCQFTYTFQNDQFMWMHYCETRSSQRKIAVVCGSIVNERTLFVPAISEMHSTHRVLLCADRFPPMGDRWCVYVPGAQIILSATPTYLTIVYKSDRSIWCHKDPISQRHVSFPITVPSEIKCQVIRYQEHRLYAPLIWDSIRLWDDKQCYVETGQWSSLRHISFPITIYDDQLCWIQRYQQSLIYAVPAEYGVAAVFSDRYCDVCVSYNYSERTIIMLGSPYCERFITLNYKIFSDRYIATVVEAVHRLYSYVVVQARLEPSERWCVFHPIIYNTERLSYAEVRDIFIERKPRTSPADLDVYMFKDDNKQLYISNEREIEMHGNDLDRSDIITDTIRSKHILRQKELIDDDTGEKLASTLTVSAVDNKGASIYDNAENKKQKLVASTCFYLNITIINT